MSARTYTDAQLADAVRTSPNMRQVLIKLRLVARGGNYESVRRRIEELGLPSDHLRRTRRHPYTSVELFEAVQSARSFAQLLTRLGLRAGGNRARVKARITELGLDTSPFVGEAWRKGSTTPVTPAVPLEQLLVEGRWAKSTRLKRRLIESGLKRWICESCLRETWNGRPIPLELDHVNGRRDDNRFVNLRILCPNCHAQTDTYRGRNIGLNAPV